MTNYKNMLLSGSLNSKVGRRLTLTFLVAAIGPLMIFALLSYKSINEMSVERSEEHLHMEAKFFGLILYERIQTANKFLVSISGTDVTQDSSNPQVFKNIQRMGPQASRRLIMQLPRDGRHAMGRVGNTSLLTGQYSGQSGVHLAYQSDQGLVLGTFNESYLWGGKANWPRGTTQISSEGLALFNGSSLEPDGEIDAEPAIADNPNATWYLFLGGYSHPGWEVNVQSHSTMHHRELADLAKQIAPILMLTLMLVVVVSLTQIRRILEPLSILKSNMLSLGSKGFNQVTKIVSGDEFEEVSDTLVSMAQELDQNVYIQAKLSELDRLILTGAGLTKILESAAQCAELVVNHKEIGISLLINPAYAYIHSPQSSLKRTKVSLEGTAEQRYTFLAKATSKQLKWNENPELEVHIENSPLEMRCLKGIFYSPIQVENELEGFILTSGKNGTPTTKAQQDRLSYLAGRLAVAASAIADQEKLRRKANYDALTGLPNRHALMSQLDKRFNNDKKTNDRFGLLFFDLNKFKDVNDSLGHSVGDRLLIDITKRLQLIAPKKSVVARLGGDEFVMLVDGNDDPSAIREVANSALEHIDRPFQIEHNKIQIGVSIGVALHPEHGTTPSALLKSADFAMYEAKRAGENQILEYNSTMSEKESARLEATNTLNHALESKQLQWHLQPKVCTRTGQIIGAEALVRWQKPDGSFIFPDEFIHLAEQTGLIEELGIQALRSACEQTAAIEAAGYEPIPIAVNVSLLEFSSEDFVQRVTNTILETGTDPSLIELEITESVAAKSLHEANVKLQQLSDFGIQIALDDFGTGFSSLSYLQQLTCDVVKIDRSFIRNLDTCDKDYSIVRAIIQLAHTLDKKVVAEGVENTQQETLLRELECQWAQGFKYSKAIPVDKFILLLDQWETLNPISSRKRVQGENILPVH